MNQKPERLQSAQIEMTAVPLWYSNFKIILNTREKVKMMNSLSEPWFG